MMWDPSGGGKSSPYRGIKRRKKRSINSRESKLFQMFVWRKKRRKLRGLLCDRDSTIIREILKSPQ
jgi:hypothetical protein